MDKCVAKYIKNKCKATVICVRNEKEDDECLEYLTALGCRWIGDGKKPIEWKPRDFVFGFKYPYTLYANAKMTWNTGYRIGAVEWSEMMKNAMGG